MGSESCLIEVKFFVFDEPVHKSTVDNPFHELAEGAARDYELNRSDIILEEIIGEGQFGDVHKGTYKSKDSMSVPVAIKTCKVESEESIGEKFLEEAYFKAEVFREV
ncbi:focal adhesion kinase 1 [Trichonephila clavipes]|nr:focal adhesion kinase 1 [Trichonephila clavipes]